MKTKPKQPSLLRQCRFLGMSCTLAGHGVIILCLWFVMQNSTSMALPLPIESSAIALQVVVAKRAPLAPPAPQALLPVMPEQKPDQKQEPEPKLEPEPKQEPEKKALQAKKTPPLPAKPIQKPSPKKQLSHKVPTQPAPAVNTAADMAQQQAVEAVAADAQQTLLSYLMAQIEKYKRYPNSARKLGLEGMVYFAISIDSKGNLVSIQVEKAQAHPMLQKAASESMAKVRKNWKAPANAQAISVVVPLRYSLVKK